jgi:hypothetical protein
MTNYEKVINEKKNTNLIHENYIYNSDNRTNKSECKWRCQNRKCSARGYINNDDFVLIGVHTHAFDPIKIKNFKTIVELNAKSTVNMGTNISIITSITSKLDEENILKLPKYKSLNDKCARIKKLVFKNFKPFFDDIPLFLQTDLNNNKFLQYDTGVNSLDRFIIFFSENNVNHLKHVDVVLVDGTFWSVPYNFQQLVTINCFMFGRFYPLCYFVMQSKKTLSYFEAFKKFKNMTGANFKTIVVDFETGLINALSLVFSDSSIFGCTFHFGQSMWRKIQNLGLSNDYKKDKNIRKILRMALNLIFVPIEKVKAEFARIFEKAKTHSSEKIIEFLNFLFNNYIGEVGKKPLYNIEFWNCHSRVLRNFPRSINCLEAWHRALNLNCGISHLHLGKFIEILMQENEKVRVKLIQARRHIDLSEKNYRKEALLLVILENYNNFYEDEFFDMLDRENLWDFDNS